MNRIQEITNLLRSIGFKGFKHMIYSDRIYRSYYNGINYEFYLNEREYDYKLFRSKMERIQFVDIYELESYIKEEFKYIIRRNKVEKLLK